MVSPGEDTYSHVYVIYQSIHFGAYKVADRHVTQHNFMGKHVYGHKIIDQVKVINYCVQTIIM